MTDTPKPAPATPAATPQATARLNEALEIRKNFHDMAAGLTFGNLMDFVKWLDKHVSELEHAVAMNESASQNLPAAAQPQRESEQPEQALREAQAAAIEQCAVEAGERSPEGVSSHTMLGDMWEARILKLRARAALSPQTDSQEPR